jgi:hypothetical protein
MKMLNQQATKIAIKLFELMLEHDGNYVLNTNETDSGIMAVHIEKKEAIITIIPGETSFKNIFSLAHYFMQDGELLSDPYMEFMVSDNLEKVIPILFRQDSPYTHQDVFIRENGQIRSYRPKWQKDMTDFANLWMKNIKHQQNLN